AQLPTATLAFARSPSPADVGTPGVPGWGELGSLAGMAVSTAGYLLTAFAAMRSRSFPAWMAQVLAAGTLLGLAGTVSGRLAPALLGAALASAALACMCGSIWLARTRALTVEP